MSVSYVFSVLPFIRTTQKRTQLFRGKHYPTAMKGISDTPKGVPSESVATIVARTNRWNRVNPSSAPRKNAPDYGCVRVVRMKGLEPIWSPTGT